MLQTHYADGQGKVYSLGKLPKVEDARTLQFARYLMPTIPAPPPAIDYESAVKAWGMLGNDTVGDCTCAGMSHAAMLWEANAQHKQLAVTTKQTLAAYSAITGYDPRDPSTDQGANMLDCLKWWRKHGIDRQRISAFVEVTPPNLRAAIDLFGCLYIGVALPDAVLPQSGIVPNWTCTPDGSRDKRPNPNNGHCVILAGYDATGPTVVTWGQTVKATWGFVTAYGDEFYACLAPAWTRGDHMGKGFDVASLTADLAAIAH